MKYKDLRNKLNSIGINPRFSIDIASVAERVRDFGLIHVEYFQKNKVLELLKGVECTIIDSRDLIFRKDSESREGFLYNLNSNEDPSHSEIWYTSVNNPIENNCNPFLNPGLYLGYPECCVQQYEYSKSMGEFYKNYLFSDVSIRYNEINRLCTLFNPNLLMPDFFPCSLSCMEARSFAIKIQSINDLIYTTDEIEETYKYMFAPLLIFSEKLYCFPNFKKEKNRLILHVDHKTHFINLGSILETKYWPNLANRNLLIKFKNVEGIEELQIKTEFGQEQIKFEFI